MTVESCDKSVTMMWSWYEPKPWCFLFLPRRKLTARQYRQMKRAMARQRRLEKKRSKQ